MDDFDITPNELPPQEVPMTKPKRERRPKQLAIPGTERTEIPDVEIAADAYREARDERMELTKRETEAKAHLLATMRSNNVLVYRYHDEDGEEIEARIDEEPTVKVRKTGEVERDQDDDSPHVNGAPADGLIAQAMRAQADAGIEETLDGDVVPRETEPEKPKRKRKRARKAAR